MRIQTIFVFAALIVAMGIVPGFPVLSIASASSASAQAEPVTVNVENFVRAETAAQFDRVVANAGGVNRFFHLREPAPLDQQTVTP
jgi:type III secretory pathway component EscV